MCCVFNQVPQESIGLRNRWRGRLGYIVLVILLVWFHIMSDGAEWPSTTWTLGLLLIIHKDFCLRFWKQKAFCLPWTTWADNRNRMHGYSCWENSCSSAHQSKSGKLRLPKSDKMVVTSFQKLHRADYQSPTLGSKTDGRCWYEMTFEC